MEPALHADSDRLVDAVFRELVHRTFGPTMTMADITRYSIAVSARGTMGLARADARTVEAVIRARHGEVGIARGIPEAEVGRIEAAVMLDLAEQLKLTPVQVSGLIGDAERKLAEA
jgi:hypothetical protein